MAHGADMVSRVPALPARPRAARLGAHTAVLVARRPWLVPALAPFLLLLWAELFHRVLAPGDSLLYYLPVHELAAQALRAGRLPMWNPFQFAGSPLLATAQPAPFYPLEAAFLVLPPLLANNVYVACSYSIAALGAFFYARRLARDPAGACVAGLAFASCGFMYGQIGHQSVVAAVTWLPWTLLGFERLRGRVDAAGVAALAAPLALSFLAGQPQMSVLVVVVLVLYAAAQLLLADARARTLLLQCAAILGFATAAELVSPDVWAVHAVALAAWTTVLVVLAATAVQILVRRRPRVAWAAALGIVAGAGIAAAQLLPVAAIVGATSRATLSYDDATSFSFPGSHIVLLLFPQLFGSSGDYRGQFNLTELSAYPGAAALVLAAAGLASARRDRRFVALAAAAALAFVAALGKTTMLGLLVWATPVLGQFRSWGRYAVVLDLAVAVGAAYGVAALRSRPDRGVRRATVATAALVAVGLAAPLVPAVAHYAVSGGERVHALLAPMCAALLALGCAALFRTRPALAAAACALLVAADGLVSFGLGTELPASPTTGAARTLYSPARPPAWGRVVPAAGGIVRYLYLGEHIEPALPAFPDTTALQGLRSANGYDPLAPSGYLDTVGMRQDGGVGRPAQLLRRPAWTLDLLRVSTVLAPASDIPTVPSPLYRRLGVTNGIVRYRYAPRLADAFLVGRSRPATHAAAVAAIHGAAGFDPRREALLEGCSECRGGGRPGAAGVVRDERRGNGTISLQVAARRPAALVVSEAWFPGWHASVGGHAEPVLRADALDLGVLVPPGRHTVELDYVAPGAAAGGAISLACVLALAAVLVRRRRASARRR